MTPTNEVGLVDGTAKDVPCFEYLRVQDSSGKGRIKAGLKTRLGSWLKMDDCPGAAE